tara:strand:+ start:11022 stop:11330 length:309 start_codon:yes stop_codon:yes gene_type:complete
MDSWSAVNSFVDLLESQKVAGNFDEWWSTIWKPYEKRCRDIAANKFITRKALQEFQAEKTLCFDDEVEHKRLLKHCLEVDIDSHDYMDIAWPFYKRECLRLM